MPRRLINRRPGRTGAVLLGALPFVALTAVYLAASRARLAENPDDRLLPAPGQFLDAIVRMAFEPSRRTGEYLLWTDTLASLERIGLGVSVAAMTALCIGILTGLLPCARAGLSPVVKAFSLIPPLSVLPILFITFARGELPHFAGINTFMKAPYCEDINDVGHYDAAVLGVPFDGGTTYRPGTRFGPQGMRKISALYTPFNYELGVDLREQMTLCDAGEV